MEDLAFCFVFNKISEKVDEYGQENIFFDNSLHLTFNFGTMIVFCNGSNV